MTIECPGCDRPKPHGDVFCARCTERLPWDLPGVRDWRHSLAFSQQVKNVYRTHALIARAAEWLAAQEIAESLIDEVA